MTYYSNVGNGNTSPRLVGFLGFDGVTTLDLTGPLEAFATAWHENEQREKQPSYETVIIGFDSKTFVSRSGVTFKAQHTLRTAPDMDTIIVPGGGGRGDINKRIAEWLRERATSTRRFASICGGIYPLAAAGLLDGRAVTTHWRYASEVARAFPRLRMNTAASFLRDESFYTCGGGTAGIEMSLAMIEEDYGARTALAVAREMVMSLRPPGDETRADATPFQPDVHDRLAELPGWITSRLQENLSVERLAERACLCPRHFSRLFKQTFQTTPADFVEQLRISEAEKRLTSQRTTIDSVAASVGFKSADVFRRAFERRRGVTPSNFRKQVRQQVQNSTTSTRRN